MRFECTTCCNIARMGKLRITIRKEKSPGLSGTLELVM